MDEKGIFAEMAIDAIQGEVRAVSDGIHVQFDAIEDPELRMKLGNVKTDLQLSKKDVDFVIDSASLILDGSPALNRLIQDFNLQRRE